MKHHFFVPYFLAAGLLLLWSPRAAAITISVSAATAQVGQPVTVTVTGTFSHVTGFFPPPNGALTINFGDGSPTVVRGPINGTAAGGPVTRSFTATHTYSSPGTFGIVGTAIPGVNSVTPPLSASRNIVIQGGPAPPSGAPAPQTIIDMAPGTVGLAYEEEIPVPQARNSRFRVVGGALPPGLELLANGIISGVPGKKGTFTASVLMSPPQGAPITLTLTITIRQGSLSISVDPASLQATSGTSFSEKISYRVVNPEFPLAEPARSPRGEFYAGNRLIGTNPVPLVIDLGTTNPTGEELLTVSARICELARQSGTPTIYYRRLFSSPNLNPGTAELKIQLRTAASGELRIDQMRIFFEQNNRPLILVERNERNLRGVVEIHYSGSGEFKGFWEVDGRVIQRVQRHLTYGKVFRLSTPDAPPLPTYSEGAHKLVFIITEPTAALSDIVFPEAIYHVEARSTAIVVPIDPLQPAPGAELDREGTMFHWAEVPLADVYLLEFYAPDADEPFFTAFTRQGSYELGRPLIELKFTDNKIYEWKVQAFSKEGELIAESGRSGFQISP